MRLTEPSNGSIGWYTIAAGSQIPGLASLHDEQRTYYMFTLSCSGRICHRGRCQMRRLAQRRGCDAR